LILRPRRLPAVRHALYNEQIILLVVNLVVTTRLVL
jgi:hypothetical protein